MKNKRTYIKDLKDHLDKEVTVKGWIDNRRDLMTQSPSTISNDQKNELGIHFKKA